MPTLFDAANPHVLKGQPHPIDDESRAHSAANVRPTSECLVAKAARHATNNTNATPITMSAGMILLFLHRLAGRLVILEWSTGSFGPFMVIPGHTPARGAWADSNGGLPETPSAKQTITRRAVLPAVEHARQMGCVARRCGGRGCHRFGHLVAVVVVLEDLIQIARMGLLNAVNRLGTDREEVIEAVIAGSTYSTLSSDRAARADGSYLPLKETLGDVDTSLDKVLDIETVRPLLARLSERDRIVLRLRFFEETTQTQIAERLGISQMHVSRLLARALTTVRDQVRESRPCLTARPPQ